MHGSFTHISAALVELVHLDDAVAVAESGPPPVVASDQEERVARTILFGDPSPGPRSSKKGNG
jgi:hypothetical protein